MRWDLALDVNAGHWYCAKWFDISTPKLAYVNSKSTLGPETTMNGTKRRSDKEDKFWSG